MPEGGDGGRRGGGMGWPRVPARSPRVARWGRSGEGNMTRDWDGDGH
jgi:hypothetical protein